MSTNNCSLCGNLTKFCRCGQGEWIRIGRIDPAREYVPPLGNELLPHLEMRVSDAGVIEYRALTPTGGRLINYMQDAFLLTPYGLAFARWPAGLWKEWIENGAHMPEED
ncbi:MAG: hypothetical protein WBK67_01965 [Minisyncoccales bacterium]